MGGFTSSDGGVVVVGGGGVGAKRVVSLFLTYFPFSSLLVLSSFSAFLLHTLTQPTSPDCSPRVPCYYNCSADSCISVALCRCVCRRLITLYPLLFCLTSSFLLPSSLSVRIAVVIIVVGCCLLRVLVACFKCSVV